MQTEITGENEFSNATRGHRRAGAPVGKLISTTHNIGVLSDQLPTFSDSANTSSFVQTPRVSDSTTSAVLLVLRVSPYTSFEVHPPAHYTWLEAAR